MKLDAAAGTARTNWAGNHTYLAGRLFEPESLEELQESVRTTRRLRVLGSRHSFNDIADTTGDQLSLRRMPRIFELDRGARTVTVDGGARYGEICDTLDAAGFALNNLASLPHISVAGACATATHGSGDRIGNLAAIVSALTIVRADGELQEMRRDRDADVFGGAVVSLGGLGAVVSLRLDLQPSFRMRQDLYEGLALDQVVEHFDEVTSSADSVSLFTEWRGAGFEQVWLKRRVSDADAFEAAPDFFGATRATVPIHPIRRLSADACTEQLGVPGPWHERLPHFRMDHVPSSGDELQSEYLIPRGQAVDALFAIDAIRDRLSPLVQVSEVRTVAADEQWLSTASGRASVAVHFTWQPDGDAVRDVLPLLEGALAPFAPRPHWGKMFAIPPDEVQPRYPRLAEFRDLVRRHDPEGTFRNDFMARYVFAEGEESA